MKNYTSHPSPVLSPSRPIIRLGVLTMTLGLALPAAAQTTPRSSSSGQSSSDSSTYAGSGRTGESMLKRADRRFIMKAAESGKKEMALAHLAVQQAQSAEVRTFAQRLMDDHQKVHDELMRLAQQKGVMIDDMSGMRREDGRDSAARTGQSSSGGSSTGASARSSDYSATSGSSGSTTRSAGQGTHATGGTTGTGNKWTEMFGNERHYRRLAKETGAEFDEEYLETMVDDHEDSVKLYEKTSRDATDPQVASFASQHVAALRQHLQEARTLMGKMKK